MNQPAEVATIKEKQLPIKLGITNAALTKLEKKYSNIPNAETKDGYAAIVAAKRELTPLRTGVEAERKTQVAAAVEHQKRVNSVANQIKARIVAIETPLYAAKQEVDERAARVKREAEEAEERRILAIESAVKDIQELTSGLLNADLSLLEERLAEANSIVISDAVYQEYVEPAAHHLEQVKAQLTNAVTKAKALAEQQKEIDARQKVLDEASEAQRIANEDAQRLMDNQLAEIERKQKEFDDREAEALRLEVEKAEEERLAIEQEEADKQRILDDKKNADELKARLPEDIKLQDYVKALSAVEPPELTDPMLCAIVRDIFISIADMTKTVYEKTQDIDNG